jgi:hypothetical protein
VQVDGGEGPVRGDAGERMTDHPIEGTAVEESADTMPDSRALVPADRPALAVTPQVQATELVERLAVIRDAMQNAMQKDIDYGEIPGTNKPALLKPGAEKLSVLFQLDVQLNNEKVWGPGDHLTVMSKATVYHAPSGARLGFGEGVCTTRERKYGKRQAKRTCPHCGMAAVIKGKAEYGGGWLCFKKQDGCGAKFGDGDSVIETQVVGEIDNPDLPDLWNTVVKMAEKRARVDAVLAVTGASALFTQDAEEQAPPPAQGDAHEPRNEQPTASPPAPRETPRQRIYGHASGKLKALELLNIIRDVKGSEPLNIGENDAMTRLDAAITNVKADEVAVIIKKIDEVAGA